MKTSPEINRQNARAQSFLGFWDFACSRRGASRRAGGRNFDENTLKYLKEPSFWLRVMTEAAKGQRMQPLIVYKHEIWNKIGHNKPLQSKANHPMKTNIFSLSGRFLPVIFATLCSCLCAGRVTGQVVAWGDGSYGLTNIPSQLTNAIAIAAGGWNSLALKSDGTVIQWGQITNNPAEHVPFLLTNVCAIATGADPFNLALKNNGLVVGWGGNDYGCSSVPAGLTNVVAIAAGYVHSLALKCDGTVVAWGDNSSGQTNVPAGLSNIVAVAAGEFHSLALKSDGTVVGWGDNDFGESVAPAGLSNVVAIAAGIDRFSLALKSDGSVVGWGFNPLGETKPPVGLNNAVAIAAGGDFGLALKADGTVVGWGFNLYGATSVPVGLSNVVAIAAGVYHGLALVGTSPPMLHASLSNPGRSTKDFNLSLPTQSGRVYALEYKTSLTDSNWTALPLVAGIGVNQILTDTTATNSQRLYRVRQW